MKLRTYCLPLLLTVSLGGCDLIDAATSDRPNGTQRNAMGDIIEGVGGFVSVVSDPSGASDDNFADMHRLEPFAKMVDPDSTQLTPFSISDRSLVNPVDCIVSEGTNVSWSCDFVAADGQTCTAIGTGTENADGTYSGRSTQCCPGLARDEAGALTQTCSEAGGFEVIFNATNLIFDEVAGMGGGAINVSIQDHTSGGGLSDVASVAFSDIGFCLGEPVVLPDSGTMTVDGLGALDGAPFDPLTIKFTDSPECGVALIE